MKWQCFSKWFPLAGSFSYLKEPSFRRAFHWLNTREESCNIPSKCCCWADSLPRFLRTSRVPPPFKFTLLEKAVVSKIFWILDVAHRHIVQAAAGLNLPWKQNSLCKTVKMLHSVDKPSSNLLASSVLDFAKQIWLFLITPLFFGNQC